MQLNFVDANGVPIALPDDRYTLHITDNVIVDPAGNMLDGESNAAEPLNNPTFPTGNGMPGGDFTARFTIDTRPELGDFAAAKVYVDANGNFLWDPQNTDFTNRDLTFTLQLDPTLVGRRSLACTIRYLSAISQRLSETPPTAILEARGLRHRSGGRSRLPLAVRHH